MLAMLCSNPAAMRATIGKTTPSSLSVTERPAMASQMARQTSMLPRMPRTKAVSKDRLTLASAVATAGPAKEKFSCVHQPP